MLNDVVERRTNTRCIHRRSTWARDIAKLCKFDLRDDPSAELRVHKAINHLDQAYREDRQIYPLVSPGRDLREKFDRIEDAMERDRGNHRLTEACQRERERKKRIRERRVH